MGRMAEQADGRDRAGATGGPAAVDVDGASPTAGYAAARRRRPGRIRFGIRTTLNLLALAAEVVAFGSVVVLLVHIGLTFVAANPQNVIVQWIDGLAGVVVLAFRDLFLPADPRVRLAVNDGVAAVFWLIAGLVVARALRGLGRLVGGRAA